MMADLRGLVQVPGYRQLCVSSLMWHTTRGGGLFTTSYLLTQLYDKPMINQIAGALLFAPMLLGGFLAGAISDRFERRRFVLAVQALLTPVEFVMFWLVQSGRAEMWVCFVFMFLLGLGGLVNMTAQRPLIYETVGPRFAVAALIIESTGQAASLMVGSLVGGALIEHIGLGASFFGMGVLLCLSMVLLGTVPPPSHTASKASQAVTSLRGQLRAGRALSRRSASLQAMLLGTIAINLTLFGYTPLIPAVTRQFGSGAELAGLLAAAPGFGQILAGSVLATRSPRRLSLVFVCGCVTALVGVLLLSASPVFVMAFAALFVCGLGTSAFASTQSLLAIESGDETERGLGLGLMTTCIGALPVGTLILGGLAQALGTRPALALSTSVGLGLFVLLTTGYRALLRQRRPVEDRAGDESPGGLAGDTRCRSIELSSES